jgi:hypothetical protein
LASVGTDGTTIYGVGNAVVDLEARVDDAFLARLGAVKGQMALVDAPRQAEVLAALGGREVRRCSGGSAANTLVGLSCLGGRAAFCGKVGRDELGSFFVGDLRLAGVAVDAVPADGPTGTCVVLVTPDAQRTMLTHLGAAARLGAADVGRKALEGCAWAYVEGYLLGAEPNRGAALRVVELARSAGVPVALTVSDVHVVERCADLLWELCRAQVRLLACNEQEARALTGLSQPEACARALAEGGAAVAVTLGARGSIVLAGGELHRIPAVPVEAVDTTGAGDAYAAGLLRGLTLGEDWAASGRLASRVAATVVSRLGARLPRAFAPDEVRALLRKR